MKKKHLMLIGLAVAVVPGAGIAYGSYLVYKCLKKRPKTTKDFIQSLKEEMSNEDREKNNQARIE